MNCLRDLALRDAVSEELLDSELILGPVFTVIGGHIYRNMHIVRSIYNL